MSPRGRLSAADTSWRRGLQVLDNRLKNHLFRAVACCAPGVGAEEMIDAKVSTAIGTAPIGFGDEARRSVFRRTAGLAGLAGQKNGMEIGRPERPTKATYKQLLRWDNNLKLR